MRWFGAGRQRPPDVATIAAVVEADVALARVLAGESAERHWTLTAELVATRRWEGVGGLELTEAILITVAANAAIPILELGAGAYREVHSIVVRPSDVTVSGPRASPAAGVVADGPVATIGQALGHGGPISLAWDSALAESRDPAGGRNVVIHEFAHKIDMADGLADGVPPLPDAEALGWQSLLRDEFGDGSPRPSDAVLRPYAWASPVEFFAVASEVFFCRPDELAEAKPDLYAALVGFYRWTPGPPVPDPCR